MSGIADFRLTIALPWRADGHWKELLHHFFNRQSAFSNRQYYRRVLCWPVLSFRRVAFLLERPDNLCGLTQDNQIQEEERHVCKQ